jgi:hypothetical protein
MKWLLTLCVLFSMIHICAEEPKFKDTFDIPKERFAPAGRNDYFNLEAGYQLVLEGKEDGKDARLVITVPSVTKVVDGVETRIIEERESQGGEIIEVSRNYFAIDKQTGDVYYFGEDVDIYKDGKLANHGGSWWSGKDGAHFGLFMPSNPKVGDRYYQEVAPKVAMDRFEVVSMDEKVKVPAGEYDKCLKTEETTPLESGKEYKLYAPGVGLLIDGGLKLVKSGVNVEPRK